MVEAECIFSTEDLIKLSSIGDGSQDFLRKNIYIILNDEGAEVERICIGSLCVSEKQVIGKDLSLKRGIFEIEIQLGSPDYSKIRNSAVIKYNVEKKDITNVLFNSHYIINTTTGEQIKILVVE